MIEGLEGHAAGESAVPDDGDGPPARAGALGGERHPQRGPDGGAGVPHPEGVVFALTALGERTDAAPFAHRVHAVTTSAEDFVRIALMADVPNQPIVRRVVEIMQRNGELEGAESGGKMSGRLGHALHQEPAQLVGQRRELGLGELAQVGR